MGSEIMTDFCLGRCIKFQFPGAGAHPWLLLRSYGLAFCIYDRSAADDRFAIQQIPSEVRWRLNPLLPAGGYSA